MRSKITRDFYIPKNPTKIIEDEEAKAIVYFANTINGCPYAVAFGGKRQRPDLNCYFKNEQQRDVHVQAYLNGQRRHEEAKAKRRNAQKAFKTSLKVGDILYTSWGYDQTNVEWFQVVEVKPSGKTVIIREICGQDAGDAGWMCGHTMPLKDRFVKNSKPMTKRVRKGEIITIDSVRNAYKWDGKRKYWSSYH